MSKEHLNVGSIGHVDHGKTTLTAAIMAVQATRVGGQAKTYDEIAVASAAQGRRDPTKILTISSAHVKYESDSRFYTHIDCPGHADYIKNMITGAAQMDGAIVLVDASQGPQTQTLEHILLARQVGIENLVVFINKIDIADEELIDLVEMETEEALAHQGYTDVPMIRGSALLAMKDPAGEHAEGVRKLVDALDQIPPPERKLDAPFMMPVENVYTIPGRGTVATGCVERGRIKVGEKVEIVGLRRDEDSEEVVVTGTQMHHEDVESADAGMNVGLLLRGLKRDEIRRGQVLAVPGSIKPHSKVEAEFYALSGKEGGRKNPFFSGYKPQFFFGTTDVTGKVCSTGWEMINPGDRATVNIDLEKAVGVEVGMRFAVREGKRTVGAGVVTALR